MTQTPVDGNVFSDLKEKFKRGQGLSHVSQNTVYNINLEQSEMKEAVGVSEKEKRTIRISTYVTIETSNLLDEIIMKMKKKHHKRPKLSEVLEYAIQNLYNNI